MGQVDTPENAVVYQGTYFSAIYESLLDALNQLGIKEPGPSKTATLVRDGFCTGRRFLFEDVGVNAIWLMAEQVINLRDDCGELLKTVDLRTTSTGTSRAA